MKSKRILCDMDGVLVELLPTWLHVYGQASGEWIHPDAITLYNHEQFVKKPELFWRALPVALQVAPPVHGSSVFEQLCDTYDTYVVTYCHPAAPEAIKAKDAWLSRYFPRFDRAKVVYTSQKHVVAGDYLIEDSIANIESWKAYNPQGMALLIRQPYAQAGITWEQVARVLGV